MNNLAVALAKTARKLADALEAGGLTPPALAPDICAQTIAYGMFVARLHNVTLTEMPKPHPLLQQLFEHIATPHTDRHVRILIDELDNTLNHADLKDVTDDRFTHFYEHFLTAYNPEQRKSRGVFYTPLPAVKYIIRAVDCILCREFKLPEGIADNTVSILDPATGTGTFLAEVIRHVCAYTNIDELLLRLHGFEVLPAPYLIAHLKLAMLLRNLGCPLKANQQLNIHLTNALATREPTTVSPPPMLILGNPPYNVSTANREYGKALTAPYKEGLEHETNIQPLSDDYIKFIALGQHLIKQSESGILAYISNNSFLDGVIHRKMRQTLLKTFDKIYVLNLHGNTRKKETAPDGRRDENIFNIIQGTSINIFIRTAEKKKNERSKIFYADLYGKRSGKLNFLETQHIDTSNFTVFSPPAPDYFFVPKDFSLKAEYDEGFGVHQLFIKQGTGIKFRKDNLLVKNHFTRNDVETMLADMEQLDDEQLLAKYNTAETDDWKLSDKRQYFLNVRAEDIKPVLYRVFDTRWTYYPMDKIARIIVRSDARKALMRHLLQENFVLLTLRNQPTVQEFDRVFIAKGLVEHCVLGRGTYAFPLFYYDSNGKRHVNMHAEVIGNIARRIDRLPSAWDIFDYIYGVLHDPQYRARYQEFLKFDFPRVAYPQDVVVFDRYIRIGSRLRKLHLLEEVPDISTAFPMAGDNIVKDIRFADDKVFINDTQYFSDVSVSVWNYFIGGSCPMQKYLKDRTGRVLSSAEVLHYRRVAAVLAETAQAGEI